jgi:acetyltransferase-like isoleucine patch superfamily enzyme
VRTLRRIEDYRDELGNSISTGVTMDGDIDIQFRGGNNRLEIAAGAKLEVFRASFDCDNGLLRIGTSGNVPAGRWYLRIGQDATVEIGDDVSATTPCFVSAVEGSSVRIGDDVMIASGVEIRADDGHPIFDVHTGERVNPAKDITIGNHVWLGLHSLVLAGARIGQGSVIGAKSVVTGKAPIPNNCIAVGSPAKVARRDIAWERPHLSLAKPYYKPDASTIKKSRYWKTTRQKQTPPPDLLHRVVKRFRAFFTRSG